MFVNKFRAKLLDFKKRLSDRHMYSIVLVIVGVMGIWGLYQYKRTMNLRQELDNQYNRAFLDMVTYVDNVEVLLAKSLISVTPRRTAATLQDAWREANLAQTNLGQLPVSQPVLANTSKFLVQLGDMSYTLNTKNMNGTLLGDKEYKDIQKLHGFALSLQKSLSVLQDQITTGRIKWGELTDKGTKLFGKASKNLGQQQFESMNKTFQDYPTLIYDGPFSDHMVSSKPRGIGDKKISAEEAKKRAVQFIGKDRIDSITSKGTDSEGKIRTYSFEVDFKSDNNGAKGGDNRQEESGAFIDIAQMGGSPYWMLFNRDVAKAKINIDKAKDLGKKFLEGKGYKNMKDTYFMYEDNIATINYAYTQDNVIIYPDLIKVKVAMDNGEILGFEAKGYLNAHMKRTIPKPKLSIDEARKKVNPKVEILGEGLAITPTTYNTELLCYEFKGKLNDRNFIVYVNAETGAEENILMIIDTPNGSLTI